MNMHEAFMRAADFVERNPEKYNIESLYIPNDDGPGSSGCMWGWAGYFYDHRLRGESISVLAKPSGLPGNVIVHHPALAFVTDPQTRETLNCRYANHAAKIMRLIANAHFPHHQPAVSTVSPPDHDMAYIKYHSELLAQGSKAAALVLAKEDVSALAMAA